MKSLLQNQKPSLTVASGYGSLGFPIFRYDISFFVSVIIFSSGSLGHNQKNGYAQRTEEKIRPPLLLWFLL
jgi:hypothetical protein